MGAALGLAGRGPGRTAPNPNVGCVIVQPTPGDPGGRVVGRGWTQPGGRPHAEAMALQQAGPESRGATCYTTLEPCAHRSVRGPTCSELLVDAGVARVVAATGDPDPRTDGDGFARLRAAGVAVEVGVRAEHALRALAGFLTRRTLGRPHVTLKLATSLDGRIAMADGRSRWITGPEARAHAHIERARHEAILVGRGTWEADSPRLDVRLPGLEERSPRRVVLSASDPGTCLDTATSRHPSPPRHPSLPRHPSEGWGLVESGGGAHPQDDPSLRWDDGCGPWEIVTSPQAITDLANVDHLLIEGGAATAAAFLRADLIDRLLLYRAPIVIGGGLPAIGDIGLTDLADAHGRWRLHDARPLGSDRLEVYERA